ncbi:thioesterase II family protein [Tessaracoccus sp. OH4464_COT-324]|uniref:thioesterase II family protein n=1 Tax=Tessaracoccus sp. OH4464_COT-324 TaxID=2491059 RepID=UPI000F62DBF1|nr:alpha/beta fold hydrolase [Tessaracoccus sp. OH4464_COT-324]RRD47240.1 thioesterase [Tessaracoccus sp. OH4464_COT-324]
MSTIFWLRKPMPDPKLRLVCLPYAGGTASVFREWVRLASEGLEVCPVELPGRGARLGQPLLLSVQEIVDHIIPSLSALMDRPLALFGHSMGGLVAYELCREIVRCGLPQPIHLFVSASPDPRIPRSGPAASKAPKNELIRRLAEMGGTPPAVLASKELMDLVLPIIRADFCAMENFQHQDGPALPVPVTVIGGTGDRLVSSDHLDGWRSLASSVSTVFVPGNHFFIHHSKEHVMSIILDKVFAA